MSWDYFTQIKGIIWNKESRNGWKILLSLYGNFSQAWKISENIIEEIVEDNL